MKLTWNGRIPATVKDLCACVGSGWKEIIVELVKDLEHLGWDGSVFQVKEKFGSLRFYINGGSDKVYDRINKAEEESLKTCEWCGKPGKPSANQRGWVITLCTICRKDYNKRDREETLL